MFLKDLYLRIISFASALVLTIITYTSWKKSVKREAKKEFLIEEANEYIEVTKKATSFGNFNIDTDARDFLHNRGRRRSKH